MMKKTLALTLLMLLVIFNLSAVAQDDDDDVEKDKAEFLFFGGIGMPSGDLTDWGADSLNPGNGLNFGFEGGLFLTSQVVAGLNFTYTSFAIDSDNEFTTDLKHRLYSPSLYLKYYLPMDGDFVPYVKGSVGLDFARFTTSVDNIDGSRYRQLSYDPALAYGIGIGAFYYTADYSGFFIEGNYRLSQTEDSEYVEGITFGVNSATLDIHAGFRILFGSDE